MTAFDLDPGIRWLFCMTHPDDEIALCAWIRQLSSVGSDVWISWTHSNPIREKEAVAAARKLGVSSDRLFFHGATDGSCCDEIVALKPKFDAMIGKVKPDRVVCGAFEQGHIDHDATNFLVSRSYDGPIFEAPFYYSYLTRLPRVNRFSKPEGEEILHLASDESRFKIEYARCFPSQRIFLNMAFANLQALVIGDGPLNRSERMRLQGAIDYRVPQHDLGLNAQIEESETWARWLRALDRYEEAMG
jgi:hypothetical protein